jgi:hypothetical protein
MTNHPNPKGSSMKAWHNDPNLKAEVLSRMLQHRVEDGIIQGSYQVYAPEVASQYRGCLIGCTLPMGRVTEWGEGFLDPPVTYRDIDDMEWHPLVEEMYGIPESVNRLWERVFETLPVEKAAWFAVTTIEATPVGADMDVVASRLDQEIRDKFGDRDHAVRLSALYVRNVIDYQTAIWMAETIIRVLQESDPNPHVQPIVAYATTEEETNVPIPA